MGYGRIIRRSVSRFGLKPERPQSHSDRRYRLTGEEIAEAAASKFGFTNFAGKISQGIFIQYDRLPFL
jgi:hypothetical protein